jgi:16S rRNA (cytosine967-C5)-methyltransferase
MSQSPNPRVLAANILKTLVMQQSSLTSQLQLLEKKYPHFEQLNFCKELCFGVCRWFFTLKKEVDVFLKQALKNKDLDIYCLLLIGIYQLKFLNVPDYAAVNETANAAKKMKKMWAVPFINAILRQWQRHQPIIEENDLAAFYSHPDWLIKKIQESRPQHWQMILEANNEKPPLHLRINSQKISRDDYLNQLKQENISATALPDNPQGVWIINPVPTEQLPGFDRGWFFVQDASAQLAAPLLEIAENQTVLDACAAPGGKTTHLLEIQPKLKNLLAIDVDEARTKKISENLKRLDLKADVLCRDILNLSTWWDGNYFDRILLDAPCSATGVIRRHPDIKLLRNVTDIAQLHSLQQKILQQLWQTLKPGGLLLYVTCSILKDENENIISNFINQQADAIEKKINASWGIELSQGRQILPSPQKGDGFFYCLLQKQS